jgi:hypothetical protein
MWRSRSPAGKVTKQQQQQQQHQILQPAAAEAR